MKLSQTRQAIVEGIWKKVDKYGISAEERFIEPLLAHIKELMPDSDQEVDIQIPMQEIANRLMIQALNDYTESIVRALFGEMKPIFEDWCSESQYVTGGWNSNDEYDPEHDAMTEYRWFRHKTAWEQFASMLDARISGKPIDDIKEELTNDTK